MLSIISPVLAVNPPTGLAAPQTNTAITISWTPPSPTPYGYRIFYKAVGATGPPQSVVVNDSSATSYDLTVSQGDVNYTISMQTLSATQLSSAVTEEVLSAGNF